MLIISLQERQTGLYYGAYWEDAIGNNWLRIQTDVMNPLFRSGDYAGGRSQRAGGDTAADSERTPAPTGTPAAAGPGRVVDRTAGDPDPGRVDHRICYVKSVTGKTGPDGWPPGRRRCWPNRAAASGINELVEMVQMLEIKVNVTADRVAPEEAAPLREGLGSAKGLVDRSAQAYSELSHSAGDPENPRLGEAELSVLEPEYGKILDNLRQARESINGVEAQIAAVQQTVDGFPGKVAEVNAAIRAGPGTNRMN